MGLARPAFYDTPKAQPVAEARLLERIKEIAAEWPAYGYRRVTAELHAEGLIVNHKKAMRLMKENGLTVKPRRRFVITTGSDRNGPVFPNLARHCAGRTQRALGRRSHLYRDCRRLRLFGGGSGCLAASRYRLCDRQAH
jgi:transposase InsO family protein